MFLYIFIYPSPDSYRVLLFLRSSTGGGPGCPEPLCPLDEADDPGSPSRVALGRLHVDRLTSWEQLGQGLAHALSSHLELVCSAGPDPQHPLLGLDPHSISSVLIGKRGPAGGGKSLFNKDCISSRGTNLIKC